MNFMEMKINFKHIVRLASLLSVAALPLVACDEDSYEYESTGGSPVIKAIVAAANPDSLVTSAFTGTRLVVMGDNLRSVKKVFFNDQQAVLNIALITDNTMFVSVPRALPVVPTDKVYFVNCNGDSTAYPFTVDISAPVLASMACEQVGPGEVATINGDYFLDYDEFPLSVTMPDGQKVTEFQSLSQTQISFVVPDGCTESGPIAVTSKYGTTKSTKFNFRDNRGILFDFDNAYDGVNVLTNHGWHARDILSDETSISGNFVQFGNGSATMSEDGGWDDSNFSFEYWAGSWDTPPVLDKGDGIALNNLVDFSDWQNMALKFELYIPKTNPWSAGAMQLIFAGTDKVQLSAANNTFFRIADDGGYDLCRGIYRPWESTGSFNTDDKWITVTVPFSEFVYNFDGSKGSTPLSESEFASFTLFIVGGGVNGVECQPILKVDNIRAVPYK